MHEKLGWFYMDRLKLMLKKLHSIVKTYREIIYVSLWSLGLFFSAFSCLFLRADGETILNNFRDVWNNENVIDDFIYPMLLMMLLFLWDAIYASWSQRKNVFSSTIIMSLICSFFVGIIVCIMVKDSCLFWKFVGFIWSWLSLTILKWYSVDISQENTLPIANPLKDNEY